MFDFAAYLERIGRAGADSHRAPRSPFVVGLIASINHDYGRREAISDWSGPLQAITMTPDGVESSEQPRTVIPDKLEQFGLPGCQLGENGGVHARVARPGRKIVGIERVGAEKAIGGGATAFSAPTRTTRPLL